MFEYIKLNQMASFYSDEIKIWVVDNKVHYSVLSMKSGTNIEDAVSDYDIEKLNTAIEALCISSWQKHYEPDSVYMDGVSWDVKYKEEGQKAIKVSGENAWPKNWKNLLQLVKSVTGTIGDFQ